MKVVTTTAAADDDDDDDDDSYSDDKLCSNRALGDSRSWQATARRLRGVFSAC